MKKTINIPSLHRSLCLLLSIRLSISLWPSIRYHVSSLTCPSILYTSTFLLPLSSTLQHTLDAANHSNTVSDLYFNGLLLSKIFISLFLPNPLTSQEARETTYKSDPRPLGLIGKLWDVLLPPLFYWTSLALVHPNPPLPSSIHLCFASYLLSPAIMCEAQWLTWETVETWCVCPRCVKVHNSHTRVHKWSNRFCTCILHVHIWTNCICNFTSIKKHTYR